MYIARKYEKYTNYNRYIVHPWAINHKVDVSLLEALITTLINGNHKKPYVRFMWHKGDEPMCIVYSNLTGGETLTRMVSFNEAVQIINNKTQQS